MRIRPGADVAASAAVVRISIQIAALAVALDSAFDASVETGSADALPKLVRTRARAAETTTAAVVEVILQIGAIGTATGLAKVATVVAAGAAVRVGSQVAACAAANCGGTTGVIATGAA
jgi:hypothetical protein